MKVLLDTDILLDVALRRPGFFEDSAAVLSWAEANPGEAAVAWHSLANLFYLVRLDGRKFIRELLEFVEVAPVGTEEMRAALGFPMKDLEDAMQASAALHEQHGLDINTMRGQSRGEGRVFVWEETH